MAKNQSGAPGLALTLTLPRGGDLDRLAHTVPSDGLIELRILTGTYENTTAGVDQVSAVATSVDPGTGGAGNLIYPEPQQATFVNDVEVTSGPAAPPPVPDGDAIPGTPMTVDLNANGVDLDINWDAVTCNAADYVLVMSDLAAVASLSITDVGCALGNSGAAMVVPPSGDVYFMVSSVNGSGVESSHGFDGGGIHRSSTAVSFCGISSQSLAGSCP